MSMALDSEVARQLHEAGVVAVLIVDRVEDAVPLAEALLRGGIRAMELTLRTPVALDALRAIRREVPAMLAGVGTILTPEQVDAVVEAGGAFGVAPGFNPRVVGRAGEVGLPFAPGIATPTDIELAVEAGCRLLKYFPAQSLGGLKHLKGMAAPYQHLNIRYFPLGGINSGNLADYLASPLVHAVGGSWLAPRDVIIEGGWDRIAATAREATDQVLEIRAR
jgi:2-dehydro-3-deoxyphosphogluconate aldolase/(4S)-4-hydroxy-2-oxoglutarate aldolase